ncbi:MAG: FAD-dependent oxidoreductase [Clostridia bacterium]|nr:FAD-dependent oxidoreductase [Clostridia bacterium]
MNTKLNHQVHDTDLCVIGAGLAGIAAALAAARHGAKVILIHDRPVPGGNASSEIRMWVRGAGGQYRESGIIAELDLENIYRNPHMNAHLWDTVLYGKLREEPNITLLFNCSVCDAETDGNRIMSVTGWQLTTYTWHTVRAKYFADCSGDSILAPLTGAKWVTGREARDEFGEPMAPKTADAKHMGMSCLLQARETDHPVKFIPPAWAECYPDEASLEGKRHDCVNSRINFWWIEVGGDTADGITDTEACRDRLLAIALGVWDHIKNRGDHGAENWELEWIGFLPGKRESRRYIGDYILTAHDLTVGTPFADTVAYGGWTMDNHDPAGIDAAGYTSNHSPVAAPYGIPYRVLYSTNVENLFFAGRNISATHMAMSSTRVMATCALMGQAVGTAAAIAVERGLSPRGVYESAIPLLQRKLMDDGCWLPGFRRPARSDIAYSCSDEERDILENGMERPLDGVGNYIVPDYPLRMTLPAPVSGARLRLAFDPDYSRTTINPTGVNNPYSQTSHRRLDFKPLSMPADLVRAYEVWAETADGGRRLIVRETENHLSHPQIPLPDGTAAVELRIEAVWGEGEARLFACDIID